MNNRNIATDSNLHVHVEEAPPPPYSETDIYSNSGAGPRTPTVANTATSPRTDDGASRVSSSTSTGEPVLTPPDTPRTASNPQQQQQQQQQSQPQPGAALYFETRPPTLTPTAAETLVHTVSVDGSSTPDDVPYRAEWAARDVTAQDWATFVNFLLPDHTTRGNEAVIDRKLRAEGHSDTSSHAEAQLGHVRESGPEAVRRREDAEATVRQWNDGFFGPRGISIQLARLDDPAPMPGSWDAAFDLGTPEQQRERGQQQRERAQQQQEQARQQREQAQQQREQAQQQRQQQGGRGRTWGGFNIDGDRVSFGDKFVADSNGLRIGSLIMDSSGIRMGAGDGAGQSGTRGIGPQPQPQPPTGSFAGPSRHGFGNHHHGRHDYHGYGDRHRRGHDMGWGWGGHGHQGGGPHGPDHHERGRHSDRKGRHHRSESADSTSSSSSSSSSSSESSIGSLPDYDDVKDQQMPLYLARLQDWTAHPDQHRSKGDVKQLKAELKEAKAAPVDPNMDKKALRAQIKALTQAWKQLKKHQRNVRKATRRERKQRRRAEKRERRQHRRDMRRSRRDVRKGRSVPAPPGMPAIPAMPAMAAPPAPPAPPAPAAPAAPPAPPAPHAWHGGCGSRGGHGPFPGPPQNIFGPSGPFGSRGVFGPGGLFGGPGGRGNHCSWGGRGGGGGGGGPFGGRGGWGGPGGPWGASASRSAPGAWPDEKQDDYSAPDGQGQGQESGVATPPPSAAAAAQYRTADELESEIQRKTTAAIDLENGAEKRAVEKELEALTEKLEQVRLQADEAYARELAAQYGQ
ncbi:RING finger domain-containing protein [Purpureocillium lilacinum]|uniref:RING finger domain-containing protein n=1 Tax=Purpureocillium lilacinum TaxID=33203 RepID=A0A179GZZ1_PURLI|nr:RING finger domain-containing protein [Purpureocillium lilacinum]GJN67930.1 hypothetical protein PLICBS_001972 [Purpureocillium lilacinum]